MGIIDNEITRLFIAHEDMKSRMNDSPEMAELYNILDSRYIGQWEQVYNTYGVINTLQPPDKNFSLMAEVLLGSKIGVVPGEIDLFSTLIYYEISKQVDSTLTLKAIDEICTIMPEYGPIFSLVGFRGSTEGNSSRILLGLIPTLQFLKLIGPIWLDRNNWPHTDRILPIVKHSIDKLNISNKTFDKLKLMGIDSIQDFTFDEAVSLLALSKAIGKTLNMKQGI